jgi:hypothetical protein
MKRQDSRPNWARNAIPTIYGWADPKTGEILVAKRGLSNPVIGFKRGRPFIQTTVPETSVEEVILEITSFEKQQPTAFVEIEITPETSVPETSVINEDMPPPRRRGRPAKVKE